MSQSKRPALSTKERLSELSPEDFEQLKEAYYKAAEGLNSLVNVLSRHRQTFKAEFLTADKAEAAFDDLQNLGKAL
jgi:hypothetical protein